MYTTIMMVCACILTVAGLICGSFALAIVCYRKGFKDGKQFATKKVQKKQDLMRNIRVV